MYYDGCFWPWHHNLLMLLGENMRHNIVFIINGHEVHSPDDMAHFSSTVGVPWQDERLAPAHRCHTISANYYCMLVVIFISYFLPFSFRKKHPLSQIITNIVSRRMTDWLLDMPWAWFICKTLFKQITIRSFVHLLQRRQNGYII